MVERLQYMGVSLGSIPGIDTNSTVVQLVEHVLGKDEVMGS